MSGLEKRIDKGEQKLFEMERELLHKKRFLRHLILKTHKNFMRTVLA